MRFSCTTLFDITATGITGHFKLTRIPFTDQAGQNINSVADWNTSRNQQRNWETLTQIIGMRTQIFNMTQPERLAGLTWRFEFETESEGIFGDVLDPVSILRLDAKGVPMLLDLENRSDLAPMLITSGAEQNIWFEPIAINNTNEI
jgi:hypothetical protein